MLILLAHGVGMGAGNSGAGTSSTPPQKPTMGTGS